MHQTTLLHNVSKLPHKSNDLWSNNPNYKWSLEVEGKKICLKIGNFRHWAIVRLIAYNYQIFAILIFRIGTYRLEGLSKQLLILLQTGSIGVECFHFYLKVQKVNSNQPRLILGLEKQAYNIMKI